MTDKKEIKELEQLSIYIDDNIQDAIKKADMEINDRQDAHQSEIIKNILSRCRIDMEKTRKELVQPYVDIKRTIDDRAKILIEPIAKAEKELNKKQIAYNNKVEEEKRKQQEEMDKLAKENDGQEEAEVEKQTIAQEAERQKVQRGINYNKKIVKVDRTKLPKEYWNIKDMQITPKVAEIKKAMQLGMRIDGVVFED